MITPAQLADEARRAALWQAQAQRRLAYQRWLYFTALAGDPAAAARAFAAWAPLMGGCAGWLDPEDDPEFDPLRISDTVNVGT